MSTKDFESYLNNHDEDAWLGALDALANAIHPVDRNAVQIWFRFFPLEFFRYIESAEDKEKTIQSLAIQGQYALRDQIDASHHFLYGHRYWKTVKAAIAAESASSENDNLELGDEIKKIAAMVAEKVKADVPLLIGITAVGLMTLVQVGLEAFAAATGETAKPAGVMAKSPDAIVAIRAKDDSQGLLGFLKTVNKDFSVRYTSSYASGKFRIKNGQELTGASAADRSKNWKALDARCWEGVIPVECTAASCGTCWVGVLGGQEKLSEVSRRERRQVKVFGYNQPDDATPFLRLACQSKAGGNATIVIPPWNGVFGKKVHGDIEDLELEPVTTSAKALREIVRTAAASDD